ncbi:MAG: UvrD-helicase domain-containing protein [Bifidobacteriaceae bacterium]|jgi:DNA helicase-2/ATP-dependent DNA helicase PcrA|nr:UvrD-helicase domain-containing protein [Bifidobacteriaceae bacterium]
MDSSQPPLIDLARLPSLGLANWDLEEATAAGQPGADAAAATLTTAASPDAAAEHLLDGLNAEQKAAVTHRGGALLVVAGAGSGKTRVLTRRIAYLLASGQARPHEILAITFTNKAAAEMKSRVEALVGPRGQNIWVSTFHSACVRILRREAKHVGLKTSFSIYDAQDSQRAMAQAIKELGLDPKKFSPKQMAHRISNLKNEMVDAESYASVVAHSNPIETATADVYRLYTNQLQAAHALDFDDLIMWTVNLFRAFPNLADNYHRRFRHILVDEYQDTNEAQYMLIRELAGIRADARDGQGYEPAQLTVVGDSDQSIYAFRGATVRNIVEFETDYPDASTILLEQNYRSTGNILTAANGIIAENQGRHPKRLWTAEGHGPKVVGYVADTEHDEAEFIAKEIDALVDQGETYGGAAIFYRVNAQSRALEEVFIRRGIPYRVVGGTRFYDRKEVRDAIAYLRAGANLDDTVAVRRIFNVPRRGLGGQTEAAVQAYAAKHRLSFGAAMGQADQIGALTPRARASIGELHKLLVDLGQMAEEGAGAQQVLGLALERSGYLAQYQDSRDPQDASRVENLAELNAVAAEFEAREPDGTLADFLERVSLVADSDQLPPAAAESDEADPQQAAGKEGSRSVADAAGAVALMTVHTAKGLEFPVVFLTGFEDGTFPHARSLGSQTELEEERRLAYVALTRAKRRLYISRAEARTTFGKPEWFVPSRFIDDIPKEVMEWRRAAGSSARLQSETWVGGSSGGTAKRYLSKPGGGPGSTGAKFGSATPRPESDVPSLRPGDLITHDVYGLGTVEDVEGEGLGQVAKIKFREEGLKRILLRFAPVVKL